MDRILTLDVLPFMVLFLPLAGFVVLSLFGDAITRQGEQKGAGLLACATVLLSFACVAWIALHHSAANVPLEQARAQLNELRAAAGGAAEQAPYAPYQPYLRDMEWIQVGGLRVAFALLVDPLSVVMMLVVTGVGALIHIYSLGYMAGDPERVRYFSYLNLFTFFMLLLVTGGSLALLFVGWEGVGLCSYLLIGFWYRKKSASDAGLKAFIVNRVGDAGLILGMIFAYHRFGSLELVDLVRGAGALVPERMGEWGPATVLCLLLFVGACGKSAQVPLHVWLPDAMEGPTPVSALIHAATMVTAGVYMVARLGPLFAASETAISIVAVVGMATALMAATVALVQTDIKRVLAYSTVSQLGYMFLACGVGAFGVAVFHLFTHAFFKALLFLGSGSVIHALSGEQDMRRMGGLWRRIPWTFATFAIGTAAIAGLPPLAGFYSKDAILAAALAAHAPWLFGLGTLTALLTAFYMGRLLFLTFAGSFRGGHEAEHHLHESPGVMLAPLVLLALGSLGAGWIPVPKLLEPVFLPPAQVAEEGHAAWLPFAATAVAAAGLLLAFHLYVRRADLPGRIYAALRAPARVLESKYGFDIACDWLAGRVVTGGSERVLWRRVDAGLIDGAVNGAAAVVGGVARAARALQPGFVRAYVLLIFGGAVALLWYLFWIRPA